MASSDEINLYITGKGGHAAMPQTYDNTVLAAAQILIDLQKVLNQNKPETTPSVLAFGKIVANGAHNIIPSEVRVHGTFRTFDEKWRATVHQLIKDTSQKTAEKFHTQCKVVIDSGYPVLINNAKATALARQTAIEYLGKENVVALDTRMTVEDFARYGQMVPACFYRLGTGNHSQKIAASLHTPTFDVDEKSISIGTGLMLWISLKTLQSAK
jgi:amidohydrolase